MQALTSIIILNYNTFELTKKCIESVKLKTTIPYEIILVDNNSTECPADEFKSLFSDIILVKNKENYGFAKGNNLGIDVAKGEYILLLNSDTIILNNAIDLAYHKLISDDTIGVLTCQILNEKYQIQQVGYEYDTIFKFLIWTFKLHKLFPALQPLRYDLAKEYETDWISGAFSFSRKIYLKYSLIRN